jgi:hypothetical protein
MNNFARVFNINYNNLNLVGQTFIRDDPEIDNVIITPTESLYYLIGNPFHHKSYYLFKQYSNRNKSYEFIVPNYEMLIPLINVTENDLQIIKILCDNFWHKNSDHTIKIKAKASIHVNPELLDIDGNVIVTYYNDDTIKILQSYTMGPLLGQVLHINDIPCSHFNQFIDYYSSNNIMIFKQEDPCENSCNPTQVLINNNSIIIENRSTISCIKMKKLLDNHGIHITNIDYSTSIKQSYLNNPILLPPINKKIYLFKWLYLDSQLSNEIENSLRNMTENYFNSILFIDFAGKHKSIIPICGGYVDLSESGNIIEAIKNVYNIMHNSTMYSHLQSILFYDSYSYHKHSGDDSHSILFDIILQFTGKNAMLIPINYIPAQYELNVIENIADCNECVD